VGNAGQTESRSRRLSLAIKRFIDPQAEFLYVSADQVMEVAKREGGIRFDVSDVTIGDNGPERTFDAVLKKYNLTKPALKRLALIVRGADNSEGFDAAVTEPGGNCGRVPIRLSE
jgi:hypothetical protein